jgi:putative flippase GtrA
MLHSTGLSFIVIVRRSMKRYTKFLTVGMLNAFVDLVVLNGLLVVSPTTVGRTLMWYNTVAVVCAIINSYVWNRRWTFADKADGSRREQVWFFVQALLNLALNDLIVVWLSTYLIFSHSVPLFVSSNAAKALAMLLSSSMSYAFMRIFVFRARS